MTREPGVNRRGAIESIELRPAISHLPTRDSAFDGPATIHFNCPRCRLTITPRASWLAIAHCPRCIARSGVAVSLFTSTLPTGELCDADAASRSDRIDAAPTVHQKLVRACYGSDL